MDYSRAEQDILDCLAKIKPNRITEKRLKMFSTPMTRLSNRKIDYYFDEELRMIYRKDIIHNPKFTYIAKSSIYDGVYKIGHSANIKQRLSSLNSSSATIYSRLGLELYAYCERDIEYLVISGIGSNYYRGALPPPLKSAEEIAIVDDADIEKAALAFGFTLCPPGQYPSDLSVETRDYFNACGQMCEYHIITSFTDHNGEKRNTRYEQLANHNYYEDDDEEENE